MSLGSALHTDGSPGPVLLHQRNHHESEVNQNDNYLLRPAATSVVVITRKEIKS